MTMTMTMTNIPLSVIVPVYRAATLLVPVVQECLAVVPQFFPDYEVILVDDGSTDATPTIADNLAAHHDPVMVIHHRRRQGYGCALLSGGRAARGEYILLIDTSSLANLSEIAPLVPYVGQYDLVMGYPHQSPPRSFPRIPQILSFRCFHRFHDRAMTRLVNRLLGLDIQDVGYPCRFFRTTLLQEQPFRSYGPLISAEIYAWARQRGSLPIQVSVQHHTRRGRWRYRYDRVGLRSLRDVLRLWGR
ncbi:MAG: glycosyltransferase family 2 protein [Chloroflexaceae bacterium]|nr:glycosyltransferase family 2 protein [Chloroflexaceae bacterium]